MIIFLLAILFILLYVKAVFFWVYLWQLKEYRFDRFLAEYGEFRKILKFWVLAGGRRIRWPKPTAKAVLLTLLSLAVIFALPGLPFNYSSGSAIAVYFLIVYFLLPIIVSLLVLIFKIPTNLWKMLVYSRARKKIAGMKNLEVVGIAGSYGKSSTKEFLAQILAHKFKVLKTPENINSEIGIAKFILNNLKPDTEIFVVEMGAYRRGEIKKICSIVKPKVGILTGISEQHLGLFGSLENIEKAKFELIESLPPDGAAVLNGENKKSLALAEKWPGRKIIYRHNPTAVHGKIPAHYELNLNGALEVAKELGMTQEEVDKALGQVKLGGNMLKTFSGRNGALIIDDTYSMNPDGVLAALDYLAVQPRARKIVVMPCLIELGRAAYEVHRRIGEKISRVADAAFITTSDYFEDIKRGAGDKAILVKNSQKLRSFVEKKLDSGTAVLLEGRLSPDIVGYFSETSK